MVGDRPDSIDTRYEETGNDERPNGDLEQVIFPRCNCASICVSKPRHTHAKQSNPTVPSSLLL